MLPTTAISITEHARRRYQERIDATATDAQIIRHVMRSRGAGKKTIKRIKQTCPQHRRLVNVAMANTRYIYMTAGDGVVFVIYSRGAGDWVLKTCWRWYSP